MRPIKFRAWDKERKQWIPHSSQVRLEINSTQVLHLHESNESCSYYADCGHVDVMQFTGLLDKNGKEIYEGDWIRYEQRDSTIRVRQGDVFFNQDESCWCVHAQIENDYERLFTVHGLGVIGNIYENPELLTEKV